MRAMTRALAMAGAAMVMSVATAPLAGAQAASSPKPAKPAKPPVGRTSGTVDPCATQDNTLELNDCGEIELKKLDAALNAAYKRRLAAIDSMGNDPAMPDPGARQARALLVQAQRAWIAFRDKECGAVYAYWSSGTIRGIKYLGCMQTRTAQRTRELADWDDRP